MKLSRHVALVGLPGAGKTSVGRALARELGCGFADSDEEIEKSAGCAIGTIFAEQGEPAFRALERATILDLIDREPIIIALGGGAFADAATRNQLLSRAVVVWLDVAEDVLVERLTLDCPRPLFEGEDLRMKLGEIAALRSGHFAQAQLRCEATSSVEMVGKVRSAIEALSPAILV